MFPLTTQEITGDPSVASPNVDIDAISAPHRVTSKSGMAIDGVKLEDETPLEERINTDPSMAEERQQIFPNLQLCDDMWPGKLGRVKGFEISSAGIPTCVTTPLSHWSGKGRCRA